MHQDMLAKLRAADPMMLTDIVRQDQRSSTFELIDWTVNRLSSKGLMSPDGLFHFSRSGRAGQASRPWSVVLKIVHGGLTAGRRAGPAICGSGRASCSPPRASCSNDCPARSRAAYLR